MSRREDRRKRSRSPSKRVTSKHGRRRDSRSRSPRHSSRRPDRNSRPGPQLPITNTQWEDNRTLPVHWRPTSDMLDYNTVYGMTLPKKVVSTSSSRSLGIDNTPIHDIHLIQVLQESSYDWCLRQIAAGKTCYLEMFRSRQEAFFSTSLHRHIRDARIDFSQVLQSVAATHNMACDLTVWENRKAASAKLIQLVGDYMVSLVGTNPTQQLTERLRLLEQENQYQALRASQLSQALPEEDAIESPKETEPAATTLAPSEESGAHTPNRVTSGQFTLHSPLQNSLHPTKASLFTPTPPAKPEQVQRKLAFGSSASRPGRTKNIENMRVGSSVKVLEQEGPSSHQIQPINAWMKSKIHDVSTHGKLDDLARKLDEQLAHLPLGQIPSVNRYLVEWGMEPGKASKYKFKEAIKLLCILHEIRQ